MEKHSKTVFYILNYLTLMFYPSILYYYYISPKYYNISVLKYLKISLGFLFSML